MEEITITVNDNQVMEWLNPAQDRFVTGGGSSLPVNMYTTDVIAFSASVFTDYDIDLNYQWRITYPYSSGSGEADVAESLEETLEYAFPSDTEEVLGPGTWAGTYKVTLYIWELYNLDCYLCTSFTYTWETTIIVEENPGVCDLTNATAILDSI